MMNINKTLSASLIVFSLSLPAFADDNNTQQSPNLQPNAGINMPRQHMGCHQGGMPMMGGPRGMPMMNMMQQKQVHMQRMETHLGNIESLLKELVALQKK